MLRDAEVPDDRNVIKATAEKIIKNKKNSIKIQRI